MLRSKSDRGLPRKVHVFPTHLEEFAQHGLCFTNAKEACLLWDRIVRTTSDRRPFAVTINPVFKYYYERIKPLLRTIFGTQVPFCCSGKLQDDPLIYLPELDLCLAFPCQPEQLRTIIQHASSRAPLGRGSQTVLDLDARKCWQVDASRFIVRNTDWCLNLMTSRTGLRSPLREIAKCLLGDSDDEVVAAPYKLLIYESGDFFKPHVDTQRSPSMFATLTVSLPVCGKGQSDGGRNGHGHGEDDDAKKHQSMGTGELVIQHHDRQETFRFDDAKQAQWVAFFTDCVHEIKPLRSGYRVALTYNVMRVRSTAEFKHEKNKQDKTIRKSRQAIVMQQLADKLDSTTASRFFVENTVRWLCLQLPGQRLGWFCQHRYAEKSLQRRHLKGVDDLLAQSLEKLFGPVLTTSMSTTAKIKAMEIKDHVDSTGRQLVLSVCQVVVQKSQPDSRYFDVARAGHYMDHNQYFLGCYGQAHVMWMNGDEMMAPSGQPDSMEQFDSGNEGAKPGYLYNLTAIFLTSAHHLELSDDDDEENEASEDEHDVSDSE